MTTIKIDMSEIENLRELIILCCEKFEGIISRIKKLKADMEVSSEFLVLPQSSAVLDSIDNCLATLTYTNNMMIEFRTSIIETPDKFSANENAMIKTIEELTAKLDFIASNMYMVMNDDNEKKEKNK